MIRYARRNAAGLEQPVWLCKRHARALASELTQVLAGERKGPRCAECEADKRDARRRSEARAEAEKR